MENQLTEGYRLSPQQRRVWRVQGESSAFRSQCAIKVDGCMEDATLRRAVENVVGRYDILRARFHRRPGIKIPIQVVEREMEVRWEDIDLRGMKEAEREARLREIYEVETGDDSEQESRSLMRAKLVSLGERNRVLIISLPSLCADGWAVGSLAREIGAAGSNGARHAAEAGEDFQYFQFAEWQDEILESEDEHARLGKEYWEKETARIGSLVLPHEMNLDVAGRFAPRLAEAKIEATIARGIKQVAAQYSLNEREVLAAAWTTLIGVLSGQEEVVIWEVMDGRKYEELKGAVGLYAKSIPVRVKLDGRESFATLLLRRSDRASAAYELQDYYNSDANMARSQKPGQNPISFECWDGNWSHTEADTTFTLVRQYSCIDRFKVRLSCFVSGDYIKAELHYDPDVYNQGTVEQMAGWLTRLLEQVVSDPEIAINRIDLLNRFERHQLLVELNDTDRVPPAERCIHDLFEEQVARTPEALAGVFEGEFLSYRELNRRANRLAHQLQSSGVTADQPVGLYLNRSVNLLVGMLGILKAGGAYVPIDPANPGKRLAMMLDDLGPCVVVTSQQLAAALAEHTGKVICLDADLQPTSEQDDHSPVSGVTAENLVYIVFTSGSTGRPKGVAVEHRHLHNYVRGIIERLALPAEASFATVSTFAADLGNTAIYPSLLTGGCLHIISLERATDPSGFGDYFSRHGIDCLKIVPSHLAALIASSGPELLMPRRRLVLGGEASRSSWAEELRLLAPNCAIFNHYGPTETTVGVFTYSLADGAAAQTCSTLPLGRPIPNARGYILGWGMQCFPPGVSGELYIGGAGVARGYMNRPDLTAERFVPDPFSSPSGTRLYRTGDVARYLRDGNVEFLGRSDDQVKFHGYRVELNEIRLALNRHRLIRDSVVVVAKDNNGDGVIIAYYLARQEMEVAELRKFLSETVIEETIPNIFVHMKKLPLTINGKIDYRALPSIEEAKKHLKRKYLPPRTKTEKVIAEIWAAVLGLDRVGLEDNFFELGGHSLLATQVISRLREELELQVPLRVMFESPTVAGLAEAVERERSAGRQAAAPAIRVVSRERELPLSYAQQRLWFIHQLEPDSPAYNIPYAVRLGGVLDIPALKHGLQEISQRHEVLRTTFSAEGGRPRQVIDERFEAEVPIWDVGEVEEGEREELARQIARKEATRPFDLERGPMWRAALVRLGEKDHVLLLNMHHVVSDYWSTGVLVREFMAFYETFRLGGSSPLPELDVQYADFAVWQREWLQGEVLEEQVGYWRRQLDAMPGLELPTDRPRPAVAGYRGANVPFRLSTELSERLKELSQREGVTLFMTLLGGFKLLLSRYAGQEDIVVGTDVANRNRLETEGLIGFFVNQLVLRTDLSGDPTFRELLQRVRETTVGAYEYQDVPFEKLVEELTPERDLSRHPLFQVTFALTNAAPTDETLTGLSLTPFGQAGGTVKFDLELVMVEGEQGLRGGINYDTELFESHTIVRMVEHLKRLLEGMVNGPDQKINELSLLTDTEQWQLTGEWNDTQSQHPEHQCLPQLFEQQVRIRPDAVAVSHQGQSLTYAELNRQANSVARLLAVQGVGPEVTVAVLAHRGIELLISMIGVFKAGGIYLPLDPLYPVDRVRQVLRSSDSRVVLTSSRLADKLDGIFEEEVYTPAILQIEELLASSEQQENPQVITGPGNLAYLIYTSGSTGMPKGVMIEHRGMLNHLYAKVSELRLGEADTIAETASQSFDISIWQFLAALLVGGRVHIVEEDEAHDPAGLLKESAEEEITVLEVVPSMLRAMLDEMDWSAAYEAGFSGLKVLMVTGEALPPDLCRRWLSRKPEIPIVNAYGPTECSDDVTHEKLERGPAEEETRVAIGRSLSNLRTYVVDKKGRQAPIGVAGELCVGGIGVGRGYYNESGQTARSFIPDPYGGEAGERLYRTGDRARYRADGRVEFIGRFDHQVKVRGYRIELGEIEAALASHSEIKEAVAIVRNGSTGDQRLVGYVVARDGVAVEATELQRHLQERLPDYMVPSAFVKLDQIPLTANGKVDRKGLPEPQTTDSLSPDLSPLSPLQQIIAGLFSVILKRQHVRVDDNFFDLGGHSLLATQLVSRIRELLAVELPLRSLFESPTVSALAQAVERQRSSGRGLQSPPILAVSRHQRIPLSYAQQRLWFIQQLDPLASAYNMPAAIRFSGPVNLTLLAQTLSEIARRHEVLRTRLVTVNGQPVQVIDPPAEIELSACDLSHMRGDDQTPSGLELVARQLVAELTSRPFDLERGPVWRASLIDLSPLDHLLVVCFHHVAGDGWSTGLLVSEFTSLYESYREGKQSRLSELEVQYADFAVWQREWLQGEVLQQQIDYWKRQLAAAPVLELPTDRPRPAMASHRGEVLNFSFCADLTARLNSLSRSEGVTLFMTLLAAFQALLARHSGQTDILVGTPVSGRTRGETESLIGFFVNTLVMRTDLGGSPTVGELLGRVREVSLEAYSNQEVPFEKLVEELQPERSLSWEPLFQVMLILQNAPRVEGEVRGIGVRKEEVRRQNAKFDLTLVMTEAGGEIVGGLEYATDLYEGSRMKRMIEQLRRVMEWMCEGRERVVKEARLLSEAEMQQVMVEWNETRRRYELEKSVEEKIEEEAARRPERVAVVCGEEEVSYGELSRRVGEVARYLRRRGVGPEEKVGVCVERGVEMVVGVLGVMRAGGAFVPMDAKYPVERVRVHDGGQRGPGGGDAGESEKEDEKRGARGRRSGVGEPG